MGLNIVGKIATRIALLISSRRGKTMILSELLFRIILTFGEILSKIPTNMSHLLIFLFKCTLYLRW